MQGRGYSRICETCDLVPIFEDRQLILNQHPHSVILHNKKVLTSKGVDLGSEFDNYT